MLQQVVCVVYMCCCDRCVDVAASRGCVVYMCYCDRCVDVAASRVCCVHVLL